MKVPLIFLSILLAIVSGPGSAAGFNATDWNGFSKTCDTEDPHRMSLSCHGIRIIRKVVQQLLIQSVRRRKIEIFDGITLAESDDAALKPRSNEASSILNFLESRELRIKLPNLLPDNVEPALNQTLKDVATARGKGGGGGYGGGGGGGGKKGGGGAMMAVMLMCKMMAALGFGALGMLAMKALMISALALMLSLIVAAKKLQGGQHEDHAHVVYAQEGHHHKKRSVDLEKDIAFSPYRGYAHYARSNTTT